MPVVSNQTPAPDATGISRTGTIAFDVTDDPDGIKQLTIQVLIDIDGGGFVAAVINGTIQHPWDGGGSSAGPVTDGFAYVLDFLGVWPANAAVTVKIDADDTLDNPMTQVVYSFTTGATPAAAALELVQIARG